MKKLYIAFFLLFLLSACTAAIPVTPNESSEPFYGVWITSAEAACESDLRDEYEEKIAVMLEVLRSYGVTDIFVQVRPECDALYSSDIFPKSRYASPAGFDPFEVICEKAGENSLNVHAWINPYRVSTSVSSVRELPSSSPALSLYEEDKNNLLILSSGIYLNPSSLSVQRLILDGVREIISRYDVSGIHIDDYFYPPDTGNADSESYKKYTSAYGFLSQDDWRRENVNALICGINSLTDNADLVFSISPSADIEKCRNVLYADVERWCGESGFCDMIIPQIYFGFDNSTLPFEETLTRWREMCKGPSLAVGLALYKQGKKDTYAGDGADEWINDSGVIEKQQSLCIQNGCGFCMFSASYFF